QDAATPFERDAFDASAYAPIEAPVSTPALVTLGRRLFADPRLSGTGTRSCQSCHDPGRAFTDGRSTAALLAPTRGPHRNTPTLLNAAYAPALFDDLRAASLETQAGLVLANPAEMAGSAELAAQRLTGDSSYRRAFAAAFSASANHGAVTGDAVR